MNELDTDGLVHNPKSTSSSDIEGKEIETGMHGLGVGRGHWRGPVWVSVPVEDMWIATSSREQDGPY